MNLFKAIVVWFAAAVCGWVLVLGFIWSVGTVLKAVI
jgi:hypothetical protein